MIKQIPNALTIARIAISIIIIILSALNVSNFYFVLLVLFLIATVTDYADGKIARSLNIVSSFGKIFDPLSDKILLFTMLIILYPTNIIPPVVILLLIVRDLTIDGIRSHFASRQTVVPAIFTAKAKTASMFIMVCSALIELLYPSLNLGITTLAISLIALALSYISAMQYFYIFFNKRANLTQTEHASSTK